MSFAAACGGRRLLLLGLLAVAVVLPSVLSSPTPSANQEPPPSSSSSRDIDKEDRRVSLLSSSEAPQQQTSAAPTSDASAGASPEITAADTSLVEADKGHSGNSGHSGHIKPIKKKRPMSKHKKKKQTFKDKLLPLLLIPFVIQTMLIPTFIMNLKFLAMKAMTVGKFAILLILFNLYRSWSQNAHSSNIHGTMDSMAAQNYGYNGGPEYGALFNGR